MELKEIDAEIDKIREKWDGKVIRYFDLIQMSDMVGDFARAMALIKELREHVQ